VTVLAVLAASLASLVVGYLLGAAMARRKAWRDAVPEPEVTTDEWEIALAHYERSATRCAPTYVYDAVVADLHFNPRHHARP